MYTCFDISSYFLNMAKETGDYISNLKLQKLVYYAQAWHLAIRGGCLFDEDFQAMVHGPVIPKLYDKYKSFTWHPIIDESVEAPKFDSPTAAVLEDVADVYFPLTAYELERMTHAEDPWINARGAIPPDEPSGSIIRKEWMKEYFGKRVKAD